MTAYRLPAGAVLLDGPDLDALAYCIEVTQRARGRNGLPPSRRVNALARLVAAPGHPDTADEPVGDADDMTTEEAAELLGVSRRTARRLAPALGGRLVGGRWLLDRQAVTEHLEGTAA